MIGVSNQQGALIMSNFTLIATEVFTKKQMVAVVIENGCSEWKGNPRAFPRINYKIEFKEIELLSEKDVIFQHNNMQEVELLISKLFVKEFESSNHKYFGELLNIGFYRCNAKAVNLNFVTEILENNKKVIEPMVA